MKEVYVIQYMDLSPADDGSINIIGVADDVEKIEKMIVDYFGGFIFRKSKDDVRDSGVLFTMEISHGVDRYIIYVNYYNLNEI